MGMHFLACFFFFSSLCSTYGSSYHGRRQTNSGRVFRSSNGSIKTTQHRVLVNKNDIFKAFVIVCVWFNKLVRDSEKYWNAENFRVLCETLQHQLKHRCTEDVLKKTEAFYEEAQRLKCSMEQMRASTSSNAMYWTRHEIFEIVNGMLFICEGYSILSTTVNSSLDFSGDTTHLGDYYFRFMDAYATLAEMLNQPREYPVKILHMDELLRKTTKSAEISEQLFCETNHAIKNAFEKNKQHLPQTNIQTSNEGQLRTQQLNNCIQKIRCGRNIARRNDLTRSNAHELRGDDNSTTNWGYDSNTASCYGQKREPSVSQKTDPDRTSSSRVPFNLSVTKPQSASFDRYSTYCHRNGQPSCSSSRVPTDYHHSQSSVSAQRPPQPRPPPPYKFHATCHHSQSSFPAQKPLPPLPPTEISYHSQSSFSAQ